MTDESAQDAPEQPEDGGSEAPADELPEHTEGEVQPEGQANAEASA